jgi:hypothetical protein
VIDRLVRALTDEVHADAPGEFPSNREIASQPGLYAWFGDAEARALLGAPLGAELAALLYCGQAGATKWPSGKKSLATLGSRIGSQHIRGNARSSTFRLTLSTVLLAPLGLQAAGSRLTAESNGQLSSWIRDHLRVAIVAFPDRDTLAEVERAVVARLDPPLNLDHCVPTGVRAQLTTLRRSLPRK